jgi:tetratricopeptide (TPR) repeat protein
MQHTQFRLNYTEMEQAQPGLSDRFALLALFPAHYSFPPEEAAALWATDATSAAGSLDLLQQRRLVERGPGRDPMYAMPDVVRRLASEYLTNHPALSGPGQERLITCYAAVAAANSEGLPAHIAAITDVYDALTLALTWAEQQQRWADVSVMARALARFFYMRRMTNQYRSMLMRGIYAAQQTRRLDEQAWYLREQGSLAADSGDFDQAIQAFEQSIDICRQLGDERNEAQGLYEWGRAEAARGHYEAARHLINESMDIMRELQHGVLQPATLHDLADLSIKQGLYDQAQREMEEALNAEIDRGDLRAQAATLYQLGELAGDRGRAQQAADYYLRSLVLDRRLKDRRHGGMNLAALGLLAALGNDAPTATRCWVAALALLRGADAPEAADVDRALDRHLGAARQNLPPDAERRALAEWWGL